MKIIDVEQGTKEWHDVRLYKVTGTRTARALKADNLDLVDEIVAEIGTDRAEERHVTEAMQRGSDYEPLAREAYEERTGYKVDQFGFLIHDKYDWFGMSPDGLVKIDKIYKHGIEIKCPKSANHVKCIRQNQIPNEYRGQVLSLFLINENLETHDFISYDNRYKTRPLHIVRTTREEVKDELIIVEAALVKFWTKVLKYHDQVTF